MLDYHDTTMNDRISQSVLVTGASGFIGRHLVRRLIELGYRVSCLVRATSCIDELKLVGAKFVTGDVTDCASIGRVLAESQAGIVFHLAGLTKALRTDEFLHINADGAESVAAACAERTDKPVLVMVSSQAAAGPCVLGKPLVESDVSKPVSAYGRSKLAAEQAAAILIIWINRWDHSNAQLRCIRRHAIRNETRPKFSIRPKFIIKRIAHSSPIFSGRTDW